MTVSFTGYGRGTPEDLIALLQKSKCAYAGDIRYWRTSARRPEWSEASLRTLLGAQYIAIPEWGNKGKYQGEIEIADFDAGLQRVRGMGGTGLFFCACGKSDNCHRMVLADSLSLENDIAIKHVKWPMPENPPGVHWDYKTKQVVKDKLAQMEEWAAKHPEQMTAEKVCKLGDIRREYADCRYFILDYLSTHETLVTDDMVRFAEQRGLDYRTVTDAGKRLLQEKLVDYNSAGPSLGNRYWHWYSLSEPGQGQSNKWEEVTHAEKTAGRDASPVQPVPATDRGTLRKRGREALETLTL